ncbi:MAG: Activator of Hsp90 ATPase 1 family protein [Microbacteriaceae bacterium]|nr:Activator of Hsp90 ATPase 1 family protein [Microbacteriaceae bacterium]
MSIIESDLFLPKPPSVVWRALVDPALLARWLMPNDFEPSVGHRFQFWAEPVPGQQFDGVIECEVLTLEPERMLAISWVSSGLDSTVTWRLHPEGTGTRLFLTHDGFDDTDPRQVTVKNILGGGWRGHLAGRLEALVAELA